jgi:chromosome segregation ATPase
MTPQTHFLITLLLNAIVTGLLGITIFYCVRLNRRIRVLQDSKSELAELIRQFDESTQIATHSISEIHKASKKINENMQARLDKANYLADDLAFMIEKANKLAERMDGQISASRGVADKASAMAGRTGRAAPAVEPEPPVAAARATPEDAAPLPSRSERAAKGIEALKSRAAELQEGNQAPPAAGGRRVGARMRSKAEQELYDALKAKGNA